MSDPNPSPAPLPPFGVITSTDQRGLILIITTLLLGFVLLCFLARVYTRVWVRGPWMRDDNVFAIACFVCCIQSSVVYVQVKKGLGRSEAFLSHDQIVQISKVGSASDFFYLLGHYISKCSMAFIFLRLSPHPGHIRASWTAIAGSVLLAVTSILLVSVDCRPGHPWSHVSTHCPNQLLRWDLIAAFDVLTEVVIFSILIYIVKNLQMSLQNKAKTAAVFGIRLPIIALCLIRLHYIKATLNSPNPTYTGAVASVWTQTELDYSVMAGTLVYLGPFMQPFSNTFQQSRTPHTAHTGSSNSFGLRSFTSRASHHHNKPEELRDDEPGLLKSHPTIITRSLPTADQSTFRPDQISHTATVSHEAQGSDQKSIGSTESRQMIIRKNLQWSVDHE